MKVKIKHIITIILWGSFAVAASVVLLASVSQRNNSTCSGLSISIYHNGNKCITEKEIEEVITASSNLQSTAIKKINLKNLEQALYSNKWIEQAELFIDNKGILHANINQREPIARLFTTDGTNFYIDSLALRLPSTIANPARVLVITGFTTSNETLAKADSLLLQNATLLAKGIYYDTLLQKQIVQINILPNGDFELYPLLGNHTVLFGNTERLIQKLNYLKAFYTQALPKYGLNMYEKIDIRFRNQVVATKLGVAKTMVDSTDVKQDSLGVVNSVDSLNKNN